MSDITAADVREALLWLADDDTWCREVAAANYSERETGVSVVMAARAKAVARAAMADEARAVGDR